MLKKLRRKFILISMISVFLVLFATIGAINISNYVAVENNAKDSLTEVIEIGAQELGPGSSQPGNPGGVNPRMVHYFITVYNEDGTIKEKNYQHMFMYSDSECEELTTKAFKDEISGGKYGDLRYRKTIKNDGCTYVAFVDLKEQLDNFKNFLAISSLVSVGAYLALLGLIVVASKIAFKPSEEAYKKQKQFITNASHELKTPLTIISADIDLIEMDNGKSEWTNSVHDQIERLTKMTNQLVDLSRLEEDEPTNYPFANFSVNEICKAAIDAFTPNFKKEQIKFAHNITGNLTMYGNKHLIEELIYIFLDNSLKYTGGELKSSYFVVSEDNKGKIELRFSNTLDKDDETDPKQILERFYRSPSNKKEGSGVGLSIAQEIVNLHKGKIKVEKNENTIAFYIKFDK